MKTGVFISAILHALALIVLTFGLPWSAPKQPPIEQITEVTVISAAEFDAAISSEPIIPLMDLSAMTAPTSEVNDASRPDDTVAPIETEMDVTEAPTERDVDPDLTALEQVAQPEVAVTTAQPFVTASPDIAPSISTNMSSTFGSGLNGNAANATLNTPSVPRSAPRITTMAAPPSPDDARIDTQTSDAAVPDETATETVEESDATAVEESVSEIVPEAQPDVPPSAAPPRASRPPRRSANVEIASDMAAEMAAEIAREIDEAEAAAEAEALAANQSEINDLVSQIEEPPALNVQLNSGQRAGIIEAVSNNWNKNIVLTKENYERLVVVVEVRVASNGKIIGGSVKPLAPADPTGDFIVAYEAARRSILRAEIIPIPAEQFPEGVRLELTFDPINDTAGIN